MSASPFFSVVIPTKNRSDRLKNAIQSVLRQTFDDYEIVVVDNDDVAGPNHRVVADFSDSRIRYIHTGQLSMPDNWEYAHHQATGTYIKFLSDRQLLKRWALETVYDAVRQEQHLIVSWNTDDIDDSIQDSVFFKLHHKKSTREHQLINTKELLQRFLYSHRALSWRFLPRGLNSVCHRSLIEMIVSGPAKRLCHSATPDFTMAYLQLAYRDNLLYIDEALNVSCSGVSSGREFRLKKGATGERFIKDIGEENFYNRVPVKALTTQNTLYNDYANIRALVPEKLDEYPIPLVNYFVLTYSDIRLYELVGVKTALDLKAWDTALKMQSDSIQNDVHNRLRGQKLKYSITLGNRIDLRWLQQLLRIYRKTKSPKFSNVIAALEWDEAFRNSIKN
jgi:glycosyltransferase involved in cell wall biosynthesis